MAKRKVGVLISGNGTNLQALIDACANPDFPADITVVISNNEQAYGLNRAADAGIPAHIFNHKNYETRAAFEAALQEMLLHHNVELVCLAGFMRKLTPEFVGLWEGRMLNIHPSLLPQFKGGHAIEDALAAGVKTTGCTVHIVTPELDSGPVLLQTEVPILPGDTLDRLAARIHEQEHIIYPLALKMLAER